MTNERLWHKSMQQITRLLDESRNALEAAGGASDWQMTSDGSLRNESHDEGSVSGAHAALSFARGLMIVADEGMRVLASLLSMSPPVAFCLHPVSRTTIEALSRAHWLYDLDITASVRSERAIAILLDAARHRLRIATTDETKAVCVKPSHPSQQSLRRPVSAYQRRMGYLIKFATARCRPKAS